MKQCPGCGSIGRGPVCEVCATNLVDSPSPARVSEGESLWRSASGQGPASPADLPPSAAPLVPEPVAGRSARSGGLVLAAVGVLVAGLLGGILIASGGGDDDASAEGRSGDVTVETELTAPPTTRATTTTVAPATVAPTTVPPPPPPPPPPTTLPADPNTVAFLQLVDLMNTDAPQVSAVAENWVPQLSAKQNGTVWEGVTYDFQAILVDHLRLRESFGAVLVDGATYNFKTNGAPMAGWFITLVPEAYSNPSGALGWCTANRIDSDNCFAKLLTNNQDAGDTIELNP